MPLTDETDALVEKLARTIMLHFDCDPDVFIGMHGSRGHFDDCARAILPIIGADRTRQLENAVRAAQERLLPFVRHKETCVLRDPWLGDPQHECTCGLTDALWAIPPGVDDPDAPTAEDLVSVARGRAEALGVVVALLTSGQDPAPKA